jgi:hypothetical protein
MTKFLAFKNYVIIQFLALKNYVITQFLALKKLCNIIVPFLAFKTYTIVHKQKSTVQWRFLTCGASVKAITIGRDLAGIGCVNLAHHDSEGGVWDVVAVKQNVHVVKTILVRDEAHCVLACTTKTIQTIIRI